MMKPAPSVRSSVLPPQPSIHHSFARAALVGLALLSGGALAVSCGAPDDEGMETGSVTPGTSTAPTATPTPTGTTPGTTAPPTPTPTGTTPGTTPTPSATVPMTGPTGFANFVAAAEWVGATCGLSGCHLLPYPPALSNSDLERLEYNLAGYVVERCGNAPLVVPGDPDGSALVMAISGQCMDLLMPFGCTEPLGGIPCVVAEDIERVRAWIARGNPFD